MTPDLHKTKDGSSTLYSKHFDQFYHNPNGAVSESLYVFFEKSGLTDFLSNANSINILEIGFGTSLNFLLLLDLLKSAKNKVTVNYFTVEAYPIEIATAENLNFSEHLEHQELNKLVPDFFSDLTPGMNSKKFLNNTVSLNLFYGHFKDFDEKSVKADFVFHDPFSPDVNGELWTSEVFEKLAAHCSPKVILTTYCAASKARGAMAAAGWFVSKTRGALGKREMTIASLTEEKLTSFKRVNENRLASRYKKGDFD